MRQHNPGHIPTRMGQLQQVLDESDPLLVEVLIKKDLNGVEEMLKREIRHRDLAVSLNKPLTAYNERIKTIEAVRQMIVLKEALKMMDEAVETQTEEATKPGFTLA